MIEVVNEFTDKITAVNELRQTDFTYFKMESTTKRGAIVSVRRLRLRTVILRWTCHANVPRTSQHSNYRNLGQFLCTRLPDSTSRRSTRFLISVPCYNPVFDQNTTTS